MAVYSSKILAAASSSGLGSVSTAATPVVTLNTSRMDTQRRVILFSTGGDISATSFTINGLDITGHPQTEVMLGSTALAAPTQSFGSYLYLTSVSASGVPAFPVTLGTNNTGSNQWHNIDTTKNPTNLGFAVSMTSSGNNVVASIEYTLDDVTGTFPNQIVSPNTSSGSRLVSSQWPIIFTSTAFSSVAVNTASAITVPIAAWRLTITSTSTSTWVQAACVQSGV